MHSFIMSTRQTVVTSRPMSDAILSCPIFCVVCFSLSPWLYLLWGIASRLELPSEKNPAEKTPKRLSLRRLIESFVSSVHETVFTTRYEVLTLCEWSNLCVVCFGSSLSYVYLLWGIASRLELPSEKNPAETTSKRLSLRRNRNAFVWHVYSWSCGHNPASAWRYFELSDICVVYFSLGPWLYLLWGIASRLELPSKKNPAETNSKRLSLRRKPSVGRSNPLGTRRSLCLRNILITPLSHVASAPSCCVSTACRKVDGRCFMWSWALCSMSREELLQDWNYRLRRNPAESSSKRLRLRRMMSGETRPSVANRLLHVGTWYR